CRRHRGHDPNEHAERTGGDREVVEPVPVRLPLLVDLGEEGAEPRGSCHLLAALEHEVPHPAGQFVPHLLPARIACIVLDGVPHRVAEAVVAHARSRAADDGEPLGEEPPVRERVERRHQLALGQVTRRAEDDEDAGLGPSPEREPLDERVALLDRGRHSAALTACPPNWLRSAAFTFAANDSSCREAKRAKSAAVITGTGTSSAIASAIVQRPSPESSTYPSIFSSRPPSTSKASCSSSSSHERTTEP